MSRFFVNGKLTDETPAVGTLHGNRLPLFIGADTTGRGAPERLFVGAIDEVRVSNVARYQRDFRPKRRHAPDRDTVALFHLDHDLDGLFPDASGRRNHGWRVGNARLEEERVR